MSLNFKTGLNEMRDNNPAGEDALGKDYQASENYDTPGHVRNLCFVWPDGRMKFMNYAYLVSGEYLPDENTILLKYTTECFKVVGYNLLVLYLDLLVQSVAKIFCQNERYISMDNRIIVTEIIVK